MAKILLIVPLQSQEEQFGRYHAGGGNNLPIGLLSIATYVQGQGHEVEILDCVADNFSPEDLRSFLRKREFDIFGVQAFTNTILNAKNTIEICHNLYPDKIHLLGGVHPTVLPEETIKEIPVVDAVIIREGEYPVNLMLNNIEAGRPYHEGVSGIIRRKSDQSIDSSAKNETKLFDVESYDFVDYSLLDLNKYIPHIINYKRLPSFALYASRGCPFDCIFCSAKFVNGRTPRYRSVANIIKEILYLISKHGCKDVLFQDSTLMTNRKWVEELCNELIKHDFDITFSACSRVDQIDADLLKLLKKAGCWRLSFGIESYNQDSLSLVNKRVTIKQNMEAISLTKKAGLAVDATHIIGLPGEDLEKAWNTVKIARKMAADYSLFFLPVPYPKTGLLKACAKTGGLRDDASWKDYSSIDFSNPVFVNPLIPFDKYVNLCDKAHRYYYSSPKVIWRHFCSIRSFQDLRKYFIAAKMLFFNK